LGGIGKRSSRRNSKARQSRAGIRRFCFSPVAGAGTAILPARNAEQTTDLFGKLETIVSHCLQVQGSAAGER
jgi:hypothetical protein